MSEGGYRRAEKVPCHGGKADRSTIREERSREKHQSPRGGKVSKPEKNIFINWGEGSGRNKLGLKRMVWGEKLGEGGGRVGGGKSC